MTQERGSEKVLAAWRASLTEDKVGEIARFVDEAPARLADVTVHHGGDGMTVSLVATGDDVDWCGTGIHWWLEFWRKHGGVIHERPRVIINGTPWPDWARLDLPFGVVGDGDLVDLVEELGAGPGL